MKIDEGCLDTDDEGFILLSREFCILVENDVDLIAQVYSDLKQNLNSDQWLCARAILGPRNDIVSARAILAPRNDIVSTRAMLAPRNDIVNSINNDILKDVHGEMKEYLSWMQNNVLHIPRIS